MARRVEKIEGGALPDIPNPGFVVDGESDKERNYFPVYYDFTS
jgi:hypothetical protein